ncbi:hypothetical protein AVEN_18211-1 [Araneus ventricosus]|uniref:RNase H type-1 domain-containing protein n=1 Tax=Araneus ventricosus TaxID=182803 RepID=A0A4Y2AK99_ARAVE|nr:hypothetical protein AVEN_18211-1 [Araneus ventricosus]
MNFFPELSTHQTIFQDDIQLCTSSCSYFSPNQRQQRLFNSIQRNSLLNITGAYSATPTAVPQVIGITPLRIKAQMESILVRVGRVCRNYNWEGSRFLYQDFQQSNTPIMIHPAHSHLKDRVSVVSYPHCPAEAIYTDGSHLKGETGCDFCVIQNNVQIHQWTAKLSLHNTVFQAKALEIKDAINWADSKGIPTSIWSDSESAIRAIFSFKSSNPLIQETQQALLQNPSMQFNWIKAHVCFLCNEAADNLNKQATEEGTHFHLQAPKCHLKKLLMNLSLSKWQQDLDSGDTGRAIFNILPKVTLTPASWSKESILFATGHDPFPSYLYRFRHSAHAGKRKTLSFTQLLVIFSFYQTKCRKYSTLVGKHTFKYTIKNKNS